MTHTLARMHWNGALTALACLAISLLSPRTLLSQTVPDAPSGFPAAPRFEQAQQLFFNGQYNEAAALALELRGSAGRDLDTYELRTSALLFRMKQLIANQPDKSEAFKRCVACPALLADFLRDVTSGQALARATLAGDPGNDEALFLLGKIDLNYVWMELDPLGKKTGWDQYWEARRSLDTLLKRNPVHVRGLIARAWIDYIVDTRMPRGTRWVLGGGSRQRALAAARQAVAIDAEFFAHAEAGFAVWEMQLREKRMPDAVDAARSLARDFPENSQLALFLQVHDSIVRPSP